MNVCDMNVFNVVIKTRYTYNYMYFVHALLLISSVFDLVFVDYKKKES